MREWDVPGSRNIPPQPRDASESRGGPRIAHNQAVSAPQPGGFDSSLYESGDRYGQVCTYRPSIDCFTGDPLPTPPPPRPRPLIVYDSAGCGSGEKFEYEITPYASFTPIDATGGDLDESLENEEGGESIHFSGNSVGGVMMPAMCT